jgi:transcription antitermination factor NusG
MNSQWYVLQVTTGQELRIQGDLHRRGIQTIVPVEQRVIRQRGKWVKKQYIVFAGYVFIKIPYSFGLYYALSGIHGVLRILGGGSNPTALTHTEIKNIDKWSKILGEPSVVKFNDDDSYEILGGVLMQFKGHIKTIKRRYRRAICDVNVAGTATQITLSFIEPTEKEQTPERSRVDSSPAAGMADI